RGAALLFCIVNPHRYHGGKVGAKAAGEERGDRDGARARSGDRLTTAGSTPRVWRASLPILQVGHKIGVPMRQQRMGVTDAASRFAHGDYALASDRRPGKRVRR